jgi:hypothetical protein
MRIIILLSLLLCFASCKKASEADYLIPRDTFKKILIDFHQVDGYYSMNYGKFNYHNDTLNFYNQVLAEYGYNRARFDSTYSYYTKHTKKFDEIYEEIITELQKMEQESYLLRSFEIDTARNLYKGKKRWLLPREGITQKIPFSIAIKDSGKYSITVQLRLLPLDNAKNPRLTAYFWYNDNTKDGFRDYFPKLAYKKTQWFTVYTTSKDRPNKKFTHIKGWILDYDDKHKNSYRFVDLKTIIVARN